ncbi:MAG: FtsX-like permease family protein [Anaerolineales bacterium]|nr:FtsX-like permease family protein [Anaerolineales bacterium]MCB0017328.1 FtsX-like permease family protein [Anaerolineales bacterium]
MSTFAFILRRARHYWQVLVTLALGVILAAGLLASGPTLVDTAIEFGLRRVLLTAEPLDGHMRLFTRDEPDFIRFQALQSQVIELLQGRFGGQVLEATPAGNSRWLHPWVDAILLDNERVNFRFYDTSTDKLTEHAEFVAGGWPGELNLDSNVIPGVISEGMAAAYGLGVGDQLPLSLRPSASEVDFYLEVSGILRIIDPQELYWFGSFNPLSSQGDNRYAEQYGALVSPTQFFELSEAYFAPSEVQLSWHIILDHNNLTLPELPQLQFNATDIRERVKSIKSDLTLETNLPATLTAFEQQANSIRTPLYFLNSTVVLLGLYYVVMAATLTLEQRQREIAVMRSRGASGPQLFQLQLWEAGLICLIAFLSGPVLAYLFVTLLATLGPLADVREAGWLLRLPQAAWLAAAVGAATCIASLMLPVPSALRRSIVNYQQNLTRSGRKPLWQRFYLDVILLIIGLILLWRLQLFGSIVGGGSAGPRVDWLLLVSPLALLLGAATILLRVFPQLLNGITNLVSRLPGFAALLAFLQPSRNPSHITRLVLLLTLAMALGLFSSGLNATLDRNEVDSAIYSVGSDIRIINPDLDALPAVTATAGVEGTSVAFRGTGRLEQRIQNSFPEFNVLAIDPASFLTVSSYREDFAATSVPDMVQALEDFDTERVPLLELPGQPESFGLWLWLHEFNMDRLRLVDFDAKFTTAQGTHFNIHLNIPDANPNLEENWHYFTGAMPPLSPDNFPISLHSLWIRSRANFFDPYERPRIDELTVVDAQTGATTIVSSFETDSEQLFSSVQDMETALDRIRPGHDGQSQLAMDFLVGGLRSWRWYGMNFTGPIPDTAIPAIVSQDFQALTDVSIGDRIGTRVDAVQVNLEVVGIVDYFPTMYQEQDAGYIVTLAEPVLARINLTQPEPTVLNELYIDTEDITVSAQLIEANTALTSGRSELLEAETVRKSIKADPLALGLRSVTLFGYVLTSVLSLAGFGSHFYMSARQRATAYGVLRAIGLSPQQLYFSLVLEQSSLIFAGLALGTLLGLLLNWLTLTQLPISLGGRPPAPPFLAATDWGAVVQIYLTLTIAFLISLGMAVFLLWRTQIHRVLRVGEE